MQAHGRRFALGTLLASVLGGLALLLATIPACGAGAQIPETPAGRALSGWLEAFDSGERARIELFDNIHAPWLGIDNMMALRARTGGYALTSIEGSGALWITFHAKESATSAPITGSLVVSSGDQEHIYELSLASSADKSANIGVDAAERDDVIDRTLTLLDAYYVSLPMAHKMASAIRARQARGDYRDIADGNVLSARLADDLRAVSGDKHVDVRFSPDALPPGDPPQYADLDPTLAQRLAAKNCGFAKVEHLAPNIGYLKLDMFGEPKFCAPTAMGAMNFVANSDALIIDLRENAGGSPRMVALISSYLFDEPTHLDDTYGRGDILTAQSWSFPYFPGEKFLDKPVYVLIAKRTFSAGEEFAYDLKALKRAILVGETTGGGANLMAPHRIDDHFVALVPFARLVNPITKTNWQGTGVAPDVNAPAAQALDAAEKLAREEIAKKQPVRAGEH